MTTALTGIRLRSIERWLTPLLPPLGTLDGETRRQARYLVGGAIVASAVALSIVPELVALNAAPYRWVVLGLGLTGALAVLALVRSGRVSIASGAFPGIAIGIGALMEFFEGGASPHANVIIVGVILAGLLLRPAGALAYTAIAIVIVAGNQAAIALGWIMPATPPSGAAWVSTIRLVAMAGIFVTLLTVSLRRSAERLRRRERQLSESLRALETARETDDANRAKLRQAERMESVGRLAGGVAHDFNNLLTVIVGNTALALENPEDPTLIEAIARAADRGAQLTRRLLAFSGREPRAPERVDVHDALTDLLPLLERLLGEGISVEVRLDASAPEVLVDPGRLDQILVHLAVNAMDAMPDGGTLRFATSNTDSDRFRLTATDTGGPLSSEARDSIFEPYYSTKPDGLGLGLAAVRSAVEEIGGTIEIDPDARDGTSFALDLPRAVAAAEPGEPLPTGPAAPGEGSTVLLVEDERNVRLIVQRALERFGYDVVATSGADEAIAALRARSAPIDLCLTDVVLARELGPDVVAAVRALQPGCPVLYMSGYTAGELEQRGIDPGREFLAKPFTPDELGEAVAASIRRTSGPRQ